MRLHSHTFTKFFLHFFVTLILSGQQDDGTIARLGELNQEIAARVGEGKGRRTSDRPLAELLAERRRLLEEALRWTPQAAMQMAFTPEFAAKLRAAADSPDLEVFGEWEGTAYWVTADDFERQRASLSMILHTGNEVLQVFPASRPKQMPGGSFRVSVKGLRLGSAAAGEVRFSNQVVPENPQPCGNTGEQKFLVIPVYAADSDPLRPLGLAPAALFGEEAPSLASHWREASYGKAWVTGKVLEPVQLGRTYRFLEDHVLAADALRAAQEREDLSVYNRFIFILAGRLLESSVGGGGTLGCADYGTGQAASLMWLRDVDFYERRRAAWMAAHEGGHNLGVMHASTWEFPGATLGKPGFRGLHTEYGSIFSPMGPNDGPLPHYHALEKFRIGWLDPSEVAEIRDAGEAVLEPMGRSGAGPRAARILRDEERGEWLWVEFRKREGSYEGTLPAFTDAGAVIQLEEAFEQRGSFLLDFTPETPPQTLPWDRDRTLRSGRSWQDLHTPLRLEVSGDGDRMTVRVARERACHGLAVDQTVLNQDEAAGEIRVLAPENCAWKAQSFADWLRLEGPAEGTGPATITYRAEAIRDWTNRGGAIVVSGLVHKVLQLFPGAGPSKAEVRPAEGEGRTVEVEVDWHHPQGPEAIHAARFSLASSPGAADGCTLEYYPYWSSARHKMGDGEWGFFVPVYAPHYANPNCRVLQAMPVYAGPDGPIRLRLRLEVTARNPAQYGIYLSAIDRWFRPLEWFQAGAWTVKDSAAPALLDFVGFEAGGGPELWIQGKLRNPLGVEQTKLLRFVIVDRADLGHSCAIEVDMENYLIRLGWSPEEDWSEWSGFIGAGMLSNQRCKFQEMIWAGLPDPRELWLGFGVRFFPAFAGKKEVYSQIVSRDGTEWDWRVLGEWEVRFPAP